MNLFFTIENDNSHPEGNPCYANRYDMFVPPCDTCNMYMIGKTKILDDGFKLLNIDFQIEDFRLKFARGKLIEVLSNDAFVTLVKSANKSDA